MASDINSIAAFASVKPDVQTMRKKVLELVSQSPRTCDEIEVALGMPHQTASARLTELYRANLVRRNGRRPTRSGHTAWIYEVPR
jgi:predicted transcriptional regulator